MADPGRLLRPARVTRADLRGAPDTLFLFGDNLPRKGLGGQAREMRGEPNAVGVPTKRLPSRTRIAFLTDADFAEVRPHIVAAFVQAAEHLCAGRDLVIPAAGLGTGLAELPTRAPRIAAYIDRCVDRLGEIARA